MKKPPFLPVFIGTGFGSGFSPFAPGTAGALLASIIWIALYFLLPFSALLWTTAALVIVSTFAGIWAADKLEPYWGEDPSRVVVDEMVGVWIPLLVVPDDEKLFWYVAGAFCLFRIFDIAKPLGIRRMESLKGGVGVMMDDVLAGVYSLVLLAGVRWVIG
ncbi:phosphatidylglycerophosphatase A [uncultured Bacteroides sp.]|uniref:phosphatidylglycerophosphatase A family protein n=1 Tax=uncultured Bacteroides sp. TaxID=162156 RepID=UPI0025DA3CA6|nr:phosphatidylglycerophosphatase A [uncultured Bacteroides sp.]